VADRSKILVFMSPGVNTPGNLIKKGEGRPVDEFISSSQF